jgi:hypothetical protein
VLSRGVGLSLMLGAAAIAQQQVQVPYSTHDWTAGIVGPKQTDYFLESWADVKSPGDNRQYAVGTIEVRGTDGVRLFSGQSAQPAPPAFADLGAGQRRQVVIVQCTEAEPRAPGFQGIAWQRFYYGETTDAAGPVFTRACNGRGISVWPTDDPLTTRVAICGETYDEELPDNPVGEEFPAATATSATGFIAVFDGLGTLLWSHHLYGVDAAQSCAVTDLSIRVEDEGLEVVTYCGISTHGDPGPGTTLSLVRPFAPAPGPAGQWDGIVGRVSRTAAGAKNVEFHTNLITPEQDGLFGLAEIEADYAAMPPRDRFVVVGSIAIGADTFASSFVFDAAPTRAPMPASVVVEGLLLAGSPLHQTIARDVLVLHSGYFDVVTGVAQNMFAVVGSTNDPGLFGSATWPAPSAMRGATDGFVTMISDASPGQTLRGGAYFGGDGDDGLTGVQGWNEYPDHFVVVGFTEGFDEPGNLDIGVESFYLVSDAVGVSPTGIRRLRQDTIGGSGTDRPTVMGSINATTTGLFFDTATLGDPAGGGIAVDQRSRVNVVGQTDSPDYPSGLAFGGGRGRDAGTPPDAVRTVCDMLPAGNSYVIGGSTVIVGTGRTDGSGLQTMVDLTMTPPQAPWMLPVGFSGGTTPLCALTAFGRQIGLEPPGFVPTGAAMPNSIFRMLIEYEGPPPAAGVVGGAIIVSRPTAPPTGGSIVLSAFQFDFPGAPGTMPPGMLAGVEGYTPGLSPLFVLGLASPNHAIRQTLFAMPTPAAIGQPMTVQVFCFIPSLVPGGLGTVGNCPGVSEFTATPAMWLPL